jgi:hypothetical protein
MQAAFAYLGVASAIDGPFGSRHRHNFITSALLAISAYLHWAGWLLELAVGPRASV